MQGPFGFAEQSRLVTAIESYLHLLCCDPRIRAGMSDVRKKSYIICASIFVHLVPLHPVQFILFENNGEDDAPKVAIKVAMLAGMYLQHLVVAAGFFRPNHRQVRWLSFGIYVYFTCFLVMTSPNLLDGKEVLQDALTNVKYAVISRFFLAIASRLALHGTRGKHKRIRP